MKCLMAIVLLVALVTIVYTEDKIQGEYYGLLDEVKLAPKYVKLIEKFGDKAWHFLECMGIDWAEHCVAPTVACVAAKNIVDCIALIACEAKDAATCSKKLK